MFKTLVVIAIACSVSGCSVWQDLNAYATNNHMPSTAYVMGQNGSLYTFRGIGTSVTTINYSPGTK